MNFQSWEFEKGKAGSRLENSIIVYRKMSEEIEQMTVNEPREYHFYVIAILIDIISSLFDHIASDVSEI